MTADERVLAEPRAHWTACRPEKDEAWVADPLSFRGRWHRPRATEQLHRGRVGWMDRDATRDLSIQGSPQLRTRSRRESRRTQTEHTRNEQQSQAIHPRIISYFGTQDRLFVGNHPDRMMRSRPLRSTLEHGFRMTASMASMTAHFHSNGG
jgi:hypothetical protein